MISENNLPESGPVAVDGANKDSPAPVTGQEVEQDAPEGQEGQAETAPKEQDSSDEAAKKAKVAERRQRQRDYWKSENARLADENRQLQEKLSKTAPKQADGEPKLEDFDDAIEWSKAQAKWEAKEALKGYQQEQEARAEAQFIEQRTMAHEERLESFMQQVPDYVPKVQAALQSGLVTPEIEKAVLSSDMSEKVAYHLANHPDDLNIMRQLEQQGGKPALRMAIEKIEDYLDTNPITAVRQTRATAPISPVKSNAGKPTADPTKMSLREFEKWMNKK